LFYLLYTEHLWQFIFFAGVKLRWNNEGRGLYVFKEKTAGLGYLVTFFTAHAMLFNDVVNVIDNVAAGNGANRQVVVVCKQKPHLLCVIADSARGIMFGSKHIEELLQRFQCLI